MTAEKLEGYQNGISQLFPRSHQKPGDPLGRTIASMRLSSDLNDLRINSNHIGHRTENGDPIFGLNEYFRGELSNGTPFYIIDQHGLIVGPVIESVLEGNTTMGATLLEYDAHPDAKSAPLDLYLSVAQDYSNKLTREEAIQLAKEYLDLTDIERFNGVLQLLGFVDSTFWTGKPAMTSDVITLRDNNSFSTEFIQLGGKVKSFKIPNPRIARVEWDSEFFENIRNGSIPKEQLITTPDMDGFANMHANEIEREMIKLREIMMKSGLVVISTSPGFIDQEYAIELTKKLLSPII